MFPTLKWKDNVQQIEHHQINWHVIFILNLRCCKFVALKENTFTRFFQNHYSKQPSTLIRVLLMGGSRCSTNGRKWGSGDSPCKRKCSNFPFCWISTPPKNWVPLSLFWVRPHIGKKLIHFRKNLTACFLS